MNTTKVKVHKVTLGIIDHDEIGAKTVGDVLAHTRYPNRCISPHVMKTETKEVDWHERHPLNIITEQDEAFWQLFGAKTIGEETGESCSGCGRSNTWHPDCPDCATPRRTVEEAQEAIQEVFRERSTYVDLQWPKVMIDGRCKLDELRAMVKILESVEGS